MEVGVRQLRDGLSRHLAAVRQGHVVTVTDHGRPVARIVPVGDLTGLERLVADGRVQRPRRPKEAAPAPVEPVRGTGPVSDLVAEQRR